MKETFCIGIFFDSWVESRIIPVNVKCNVETSFQNGMGAKDA